MADKLAASLTIIPSANQGDVISPTFTNDQFRGGEFILRQTAQSSTSSFANANIQGLVPGTTQWYTIGTITPATAATFTKHLTIYPNASTANDSTTLQPSAAPYAINGFLPNTWRVSSTNTAATTSATATFSISANLYA